MSLFSSQLTPSSLSFTEAEQSKQCKKKKKQTASKNTGSGCHHGHRHLVGLWNIKLLTFQSRTFQKKQNEQKMQAECRFRGLERSAVELPSCCCLEFSIGELCDPFSQDAAVLYVWTEKTQCRGQSVIAPPLV